MYSYENDERAKSGNVINDYLSGDSGFIRLRVMLDACVQPSSPARSRISGLCAVTYFLINTLTAVNLFLCALSPEQAVNYVSTRT
jgi:hypothetical protein